MDMETVIYENYMFVRDLYTIFKVTGFILIIIGLILYVKIAINNIREEVREKLESLNTKQD